jgi:hypothetical protein
MKKVCMLLFLVWGFSLHAQVNTYFDNNPVWKVEAQWMYEMGCLETHTYNYFIQGDTLIDTIVYKKVMLQGYYLDDWIGFGWPPASCMDYGWYAPYLSFFIRSEGKKVYYREDLPGWSDSLMFDYDLEVGDTLPVTGPNPIPEVTVDSIDSVSTPNGFLKIFYLSDNVQIDYIMEGVGSERGLIESLDWWLSASSSIVCYSLNDTVYHPTSGGPSCMMYMDAENYEMQNWRVYPNPVHNEFIIQLTYEVKEGTLLFMDTHGRTIKTISNLNGTHFVLNRENLQPGIYLVELRTANGTVIKKIAVE